jgi:hypothetical protein
VTFIERVDQPAEVAQLHLAAKKDVGADIQVVGERQILVDGFYSMLAGIEAA